MLDPHTHQRTTPLPHLLMGESAQGRTEGIAGCDMRERAMHERAMHERAMRERKLGRRGMAVSHGIAVSHGPALSAGIAAVCGGAMVRGRTV